MKYDFELSLEDRNSLSILISRINPNSTVLEFGPANGRMTKYMKEQLGCKVYAVEIDERSANDAAQYTEKILVDSIENYTWKEEFKNLKFDYIIFADVLEHLYYPENVLLHVKDFLKEDGSILISIPNIAHNSIIINLLKNEFNYNPTGLLDDTHIRFFTKKTFDQLIEKSGYFTNYENAIFINPSNTEFQNSYDDIPNEFSLFLKQQYFGEAYQFIYELKKHYVDTITNFSYEKESISEPTIKLFINNNKNSLIKFPILKIRELQEFVFDISCQESLNTFHLNLFNRECVIEIDKIILITRDNKSLNIEQFISSNAVFSHGKIYFFDQVVPQLYFTNLANIDFSEIKELKITVSYLHVSDDAIKECYYCSKNELLDLRNELKLMTCSLSWKITKPLRKIKKLFGNR